MKITEPFSISTSDGMRTSCIYNLMYSEMYYNRCLLPLYRMNTSSSTSVFMFTYIVYISVQLKVIVSSLVIDIDGLICQALMTGNFEAAVDVCFNDNRMADGLLLAIAGGPDLFSRTQKRYFSQSQCGISKVCVFVSPLKSNISIYTDYNREYFNLLICASGCFSCGEPRLA